MTSLAPTIARCLGRKRGLIFCDRSYQCRLHMIIYDEQDIAELPPVELHKCNRTKDCFIPLPEEK